MDEPAAKRHRTGAENDTPEVPTSASSSAATPVLKVVSTAAMSPSPTTTKPAKYTRNDLVTLLVGPDENELVASEHRLVVCSEFFRAALKKDWKEGQTRVIKLPEEGVEIISNYLEFIYGAGLPSSTIKTGNGLRDQQDAYFELCKLYMFGERVLDVTLRNAIIEETLRLVKLRTDDDGAYWVPTWTEAAAVYRGTTVESPVRCFFIDLLVTYGEPTWLEKVDPNECPQLLLDVLKEFNKRAKDGQDPEDFRDQALDPEDYYV